MKRIVICCIAALCCCMTYAQGIPFLHNFRSNDYHAHNRNFDVVTDQNGTVYFANFEGLLLQRRAMASCLCKVFPKQRIFMVRFLRFGRMLTALVFWSTMVIYTMLQKTRWNSKWRPRTITGHTACRISSSGKH